MGVDDPAGLGELVDHAAIARLVAAYADVINRRAWPELDGLFVPGMPLHLDTVTSAPRDLRGADEVGGFIGAAVERFAFFEFVPLSHRVDLYPGGDFDAATGRLWMSEVRCGARGHPGAGEWTTAYGLYRDHYRRVDGSWRFSERWYRSLARTGSDGGAFPLPPLW
jgi:hypothetical protein